MKRLTKKQKQLIKDVWGVEDAKASKLGQHILEWFERNKHKA